MIARLHSYWYALRASYWFYPALFALCSVLLGTLTVELDHTDALAQFVEDGWLRPMHASDASDLLGVATGSMLGVAGTVFSITIAAVAYASGNYGPRLLTNFMEDKGNQLSLATFIATFVYGLTVLRAMRGGGGDEAFVPQISLLVAFAFLIVTTAVLVYFLHHIPASIRIDTVLESIGRRLLRQIATRYPEEGSRDPARRATPQGEPICAQETGYVRVIELDTLCEVAARHDHLVNLAVRTGDFVYPGVVLAHTDARRLEGAFPDEVRATMALGASRTAEQDIEFSMDELVEIALRALSPGINDPFTAITALHWIGAATADFGRRDLAFETWNRGDPACPVARLHSDFAHFLQRGFIAMRSAVATSRLAALMALEALHTAAQQVTSAHRRRLLLEEMDRLAEQAAEHLSGPDIALVRERHALLRGEG
ncbi:DUF2254 domain-containing protein [Novosphingobium mangrovi (ex Hu et al. 2023)]|uniref:DUF2254 domain-containing protein n=1 Tax=Novosphingobium mangrovi (ex Hu et al. 2023) TaxID=2930094 RepID=A0ABT0AI68_9SPHN|nr:DUF2254 domain-containing protein [Novosphingobium mangrovi (ex Hu et al. 2023)]MCJ1962891.1 DUF2254 domain-containing protein [Novosphingobium mangrovi (ex Hu et al. 2023)]